PSRSTATPTTTSSTARATSSWPMPATAPSRPSSMRCSRNASSNRPHQTSSTKRHRPLVGAFSIPGLFRTAEVRLLLLQLLRHLEDRRVDLGVVHDALDDHEPRLITFNQRKLKA